MKAIQKLLILLAVAFSAQANAQSFGLGGMGQPDREMSAGRYGQGNALRAGQQSSRSTARQQSSKSWRGSKPPRPTTAAAATATTDANNTKRSFK